MYERDVRLTSVFGSVPVKPVFSRISSSRVTKPKMVAPKPPVIIFPPRFLRIQNACLNDAAKCNCGGIIARNTHQCGGRTLIVTRSSCRKLLKRRGAAAMAIY